MKNNLPVTDKEITVNDDVSILSTTELSSAIKYVNANFVKISGFSEDDLRGQRHNIVRHPDMPQTAFKDLWETLQSGESWLGVVKNRCKNGDYYWVDAYVSPIKENGKITEYQSVCTKVDKEVVVRAEAVYKALNEDKTIAALKKPPVSQRTKLFAGFCLALLPVVVTSLINVPVIYTLLVASPHVARVH